ncbi:MAG: ferritin-like domain-containing protein [Methylotenera sp.]
MTTLDRDRPHFTTGDWDNGTFGIQNWLERTAWRTLRDTTYGYRDNVAPPSELVWEDPLINQIYKIDIATFLTAEKISVDNISRMVSMAPDEASRVFLATQAFDEARHFEVFTRRLADFGVEPDERNGLMKRVTTNAMQQFYDLIKEQVDKEDYVAALIAHNIILEGMAYPVYRYEIKYWSKLDPGLSQIVQGAFADEVHHVSYGEAYIRNLIASDVTLRNRINILLGDFEKLLIGVFEAVILHYVGLYQAAADAHKSLMGDIVIFPGKKMADLSEEEQVRLLLDEVRQEHAKRLVTIGITR